MRCGHPGDGVPTPTWLKRDVEFDADAPGTDAAVPYWLPARTPSWCGNPLNRGDSSLGDSVPCCPQRWLPSTGPERPGAELEPTPGDEVFALLKQGGFAEYVCVQEGELAPNPKNLSYEQAAAVPMAVITALLGLHDEGRIQPEQKVLINGASGGAGTFAVQLARAFGAKVAGVCSTRNVDLVRSIGADEVIDYL